MKNIQKKSDNNIIPFPIIKTLSAHKKAQSDLESESEMVNFIAESEIDQSLISGREKLRKITKIVEPQPPLLGSAKVDFKKSASIRVNMDNYNQTLAMLYANSDGSKNLRQFPSVRQYFVDQLLTYPSYVSLSKNIDANLMSGILIDYFIALLSKNYGMSHENYDTGTMIKFFRDNRDSQKWLWKELKFYMEKNQSIGRDGDIVINWTNF